VWKVRLGSGKSLYYEGLTESNDHIYPTMDEGTHTKTNYVIKSFITLLQNLHPDLRVLASYRIFKMALR